MNIELINIKNYEGTDYIYIGRGPESKYGNPYSSKKSNIAISVDTKKESVDKFREYIDDNPSIVDDLISDLLENDIRKIGCWCKNSGEIGLCHGDVYIEKINERKYKSIF